MSPEHDNDLIYASGGKPFANDQSAKSAITRLGLDPECHEPVEVEGGWAVKYTCGGDDAPDKVPADKEKTGAVKSVLDIRDGFPGYFLEACRALGFVRDKRMDGAALDNASKMRAAEAFAKKMTEAEAEQILPTLEHILNENMRVEKVKKVRFNAKSNPNDPDEVLLCSNGDRLVVQREQEVFLPQRFLESADNANHPLFKQRPGEGRKTVGKIVSYPYSVLGEGTMSDFVAQRNAGTKTTKEYVEKYGVDGKKE